MNKNHNQTTYFQTEEEYDKYANSIFNQKRELFFDALFAVYSEKDAFIKEAKERASYLTDQECNNAYIIRKHNIINNTDGEETTND